eukprot:PhM_4_TR5512/c1_g1_i1/m.101460
MTSLEHDDGLGAGTALPAAFTRRRMIDFILMSFSPCVSERRATSRSGGMPSATRGKYRVHSAATRVKPISTESAANLTTSSPVSAVRSRRSVYRNRRSWRKPTLVATLGTYRMMSSQRTPSSFEHAWYVALSTSHSTSPYLGLSSANSRSSYHCCDGVPFGGVTSVPTDSPLQVPAGRGVGHRTMTTRFRSPLPAMAIIFAPERSRGVLGGPLVPTAYDSSSPPAVATSVRTEHDAVATTGLSTLGGRATVVVRPVAISCASARPPRVTHDMALHGSSHVATAIVAMLGRPRRMAGDVVMCGKLAQSCDFQTWMAPAMRTQKSTGASSSLGNSSTWAMGASATCSTARPMKNSHLHGTLWAPHHTSSLVAAEIRAPYDGVDVMKAAGSDWATGLKAGRTSVHVTRIGSSRAL